jgi:hypothetical protein
MTDSNETVTGGGEREPARTDNPVSARRIKTAKAAARPVVSLAALLAGEDDATAAVTGALEAAGFLDHLPDGNTFQKAYARLQRHLGQGPASSGTPDRDSLLWLSLRTKSFSTTD